MSAELKWHLEPGDDTKVTLGPAPRYDWNGKRKLWHVAGCLLMIGLFWVWKDLRDPFSGPNALLFFAWMESAIAISVDILRFRSPRHQQRLMELPFYGKMLRPVEKTHFNATTYFMLSAAILVTLFRMGWCAQSTLVLALIVLGVADPAASWTRHILEKTRIGWEKTFGFAAFVLTGFLTMWAVGWGLGFHLPLGRIFWISAFAGFVESYTAYFVALVEPLTLRFHSQLTHDAVVWLMRVYPDDNLMIPLTVAALAGILL